MDQRSRNQNRVVVLQIRTKECVFRLVGQPVCCAIRKLGNRNPVTIGLLSPVSPCHYNDVIMRAMASQITSVSIVCSVACSGPDQRKHQSSASQRASNAENVSIWWRRHAGESRRCRTIMVASWITFIITYLPSLAGLEILNMERTIYCYQMGILNETH